jgi:capsule polysaccharide export protein KpsE/RkpR
MRSARNSRTRVANQIRDIIVSAPDELRSSLSDLSTPERAKHCSRFRIAANIYDPLEATRLSLRTLSKRHEALTSEMADLEATIDSLTARANPSLRGVKGAGADTYSSKSCSVQRATIPNA